MSRNKFPKRFQRKACSQGFRLSIHMQSFVFGTVSTLLGNYLDLVAVIPDDDVVPGLETAVQAREKVAEYPGLDANPGTVAFRTEMLFQRFVPDHLVQFSVFELLCHVSLSKWFSGRSSPGFPGRSRRSSGRRSPGFSRLKQLFRPSCRS